MNVVRCGPLECEGSPDDPVGLRTLHRTADDRVHAIVGSLDALGLLPPGSTVGAGYADSLRVRPAGGDLSSSGRVLGTWIES